MNQRLSNELIFEVVNDSPNPLHKSIISFLFTSGLNHDVIRSLKIKDLLDSCTDICDDKNLDDLLNKNPFHIVPCWRISNNTKVGISFNTPETTKYLFDYLKDRKKYVKLTEESYLFKDYNKNTITSVPVEEPLRKNYITTELSRKKKNLNKSHEGDEIQFNIGSIEYTFTKICEDYLLVDDSDKKELIALFQAKTTNKNKFFDEDIKQYYLELMKYLTIDSSYKNYNDVSNDEEDTTDDDSVLDIKKKISSYYMNNIKKGHKIDYDEYDRLCGIVYDLAIFYKDSKHHTFILNDNTLDNLFKKAKIQVLIEDYTEKIHMGVNEDNIYTKMDEIKHLMENIGIFYVVQIDDYQLNNVLKEYLNYHVHDYGEVVITSSAIKDIIYMCLDGFCINS